MLIKSKKYFHENKVYVFYRCLYIYRGLCTFIWRGLFRSQKSSFDI